MHIILNIVPAGSLATTGLNIALALIALALIIGAGIFAYRKGLGKGAVAAGAVIALTFANLAGGGAISEANALTSHNVKSGDIIITLEQGSTAKAKDDAIVTVNSDSANGWKFYAKLADTLPAGVGLKLADKDLALSETMLREGQASLGEYLNLTVSASADANVVVGKYEINVLLDTREKGASEDGGNTGGGGDTEPGALSMDNANFYDSLTNWAGGDLIVDGDVLDLTFTGESSIKIDSESCTTTGAGTIGNKVGCVLPNLAEGVHTVKLSVDEGENYTAVGTITYAKQIANMQEYTRPSDFIQGQVRILTDIRDSKPYCVKAMPDGKLWMCQNLAYTPVSGVDYNASTGVENIATADLDCTSYVCPKNNIAQYYDLTEVNTEPGNTTHPEYGFLYNFCLAVKDMSAGCADSLAAGNTEDGTQLPATQFDGESGILPTGWKLPTGNSSGQFKALADAMGTAASTNPVYGNNQANFIPGSPFLGVYSGRYADGLDYQNDYGIFWSSTARTDGTAYNLYFVSGNLYAGTNFMEKGWSVALRGVL